MNIPTGTVTFLFTDIEGSTKLAQDFHDLHIGLFKKHNEILYKAVESNNGFVFKTIGDSICCAFENASDAVRAAYDAQMMVNFEKWNEAVIKVRMGIHSGEAEWNENDYVGYMTLSRTQIIMSAAYGEQILISNNAYELAKEKIPSEISFRDLGERRLKDLIHPTRIYQIISAELPSDFPPLKTLDASPNNLPVQLTSFIGREEEMMQVKKLIKQTHLLTLTGSGGSGKTRLALQVAAGVIDDFANGVWFVHLASIFDPALLPQAIMKVFGLKEEPKRSLEDTLCDYLKDKEILIILDNCEHLIEQCAKLTEKLLCTSPKLKIIATSREALRCSGEQTYRVLSLDTPNPKDKISPEKLSQYEAVRLFIERAMSVDSTFHVNNNNAHALAHICYQLDGIPLAIELAAARTKVLSVEKICERLNDRFNLLIGGKRTALPRQQTLKALVDWSYDLLTEKEKILWRRLTVFAGGWTIEAAEEVCFDEKIKKEDVLELLNQLTEKSIIIFEREKERYRVLETLKQYGEEKLREANEEEEILSKHLHYFVEISETAEPKLNGSEIQIWLEKLEADHINLRSAIEWSIRDGNKEEGSRLAEALGYFWIIRGHYSTGRRLLESILDKAQGVSRNLLAKLLNRLGSIVMNLGEYEQAQKYYEESLSLRREMEDKRGIAVSLNSLGGVAFHQGNYEQAQRLYEESLALSREVGEERGIATSLNGLGIVALDRGNYEQAQKFYEESLTISFKREGKRGITDSVPLNNLGDIAYNWGNYEQAQKLYEEGLALSWEIGEKGGIAHSLNNLGNVALDKGDYEQAQKLYEESLALTREMGEKRGIAHSLNNLGNVALDKGNYEQAEKFFEEGLALTREMGEKRGIAASLSNLGNVARNQENYGQAQKFYEESLTLRFEMEDKTGIAESLKGLGNVAHNQRNYEQAQKYYEESLTLRHEIGDNSGIAESLNSLGNFALNQGNYESAQKFYEESLILRLETGYKHKISHNLLGFAGILCAANKLSMAVMLLGAVDAALKFMGTILHKDGQKLQEQIINKLHEKLSDEEFSKYFEEGKKLTFEQAAELVLSMNNE
ncbi:MAG: tetratricopeptide repeat protein [Bacteroidota bacterium]|nr:tetratricopeptide repeat protein [Bacteroidota bacterium]